MATYGRKRRGLLSSFSVFQDDSEPRTKLSGTYSHFTSLPISLSTANLPSRDCVGYSRLLSRSSSKVDITQISQQKDAEFDHGDLDELASASTSPTARSARRAMDAASIATQQLRQQSRPSPNLTAETHDKPLPPLPAPSLSKMPLHNCRSSKLPLAEKPANVPMVKLTKDDTSVMTRDKLTISAPISQKDVRPITSRSVDAPDPRLTALPRSPLPRSQSAMHFSRYLKPNHDRNTCKSTQDDLLSLNGEPYADSNSTRRKLKAISRAVEPHKGRQVLGRFRDAISDRLPGSFAARSKPVTTFPVLIEETSGLQLADDEQEADLEARAKRRMAEDKNFTTSPKVRSLTGSPSKPLLGHDSMKASLDESLKSSSSGSRVGLNISGIILDSADDDPFMEDEVRPASSPSHMLPAFDFDLPGTLPVQTAEQRILPQHVATVPRELEEVATVTEDPPSRFSNLISGLRQHPNVMEFAEPPPEYTAKSRKEPPSRSKTPEKAKTAHSKREGFQFNQSPIRKTASGALQYAPDKFEPFNPLFDDYEFLNLGNENVQIAVSSLPTITIKRASDHSKRSSAEAGLSPAQTTKKSKRVSPEGVPTSIMKRLSPASEGEDVEPMATDNSPRIHANSTDTMATAKTHASHHIADFEAISSFEHITSPDAEEEASWLLTGSSTASIRRPKTQRRVSAPYPAGGRSAVGRRASRSVSKALDYYEDGVADVYKIGHGMESSDELGKDILDHRVGWAQ